MASPKFRLLKFQEGYGWEGVEREAYKHGQEEGREWVGIIRQVLVGGKAESTRFHLRYFEIDPGGYSSLEKHRHAHVVIAVRGNGRAVIGPSSHSMSPLDTVYVGPWVPHQFLNEGKEPFGFFCIVDRERDRPVALEPEELSEALVSKLSFSSVNKRKRVEPAKQATK